MTGATGSGSVSDASAAMPVDSLTRLLLAVAVILLTCHLVAALAVRIGQAPVVGEIVGGLLLGPSIVGALDAGGTARLFTADVVDRLGVISQLGLVVFLFLLGCELERPGGRPPAATAALVGAGSLLVPFAGGLGLALLAGGPLTGSAGPWPSRVFIGLVLSVTALPVLARVLTDLHRHDTSLGVLALSAAAIGDGLTWTVLTVLVAGRGGGGRALWAVLGAGVLVAVALVVVRPVLAAQNRRVQAGRSQGVVMLPLMLAGCFSFAAAAQFLGMHPAIGGFLFGLAVPRRSAASARVTAQLQGFVLAVLLPLFFAGVGLTLRLGQLLRPGELLLTAAFLLTAMGTKFVGAGAAAWTAGLTGRQAVHLGVLMNCRGVTELVVASIGYRYGLVSGSGLAMLVLVGLVTTGVTVPFLRLTGLTRVPAEAAAVRRGLREPLTGVSGAPGIAPDLLGDLTPPSQ